MQPRGGRNQCALCGVCKWKLGVRDDNDQDMNAVLLLMFYFFSPLRCIYLLLQAGADAHCPTAGPSLLHAAGAFLLPPN